MKKEVGSGMFFARARTSLVENRGGDESGERRKVEEGPQGVVRWRYRVDGGFGVEVLGAGLEKEEPHQVHGGSRRCGDSAGQETSRAHGSMPARGVFSDIRAPSF